jgi:hypothetical protein
MRPDTANPLSFEEHRELAAELRSASMKLRELFAIINNIYGPNNQAAFSFGKTVESLERLCAELRLQAAQDCPGRDAERFYE